jgi:hypothetical protein
MVLVTVFSLAGIGSSVFAVDNKYTRETLKGINKICVIVEHLKPEVEQAGLSRSQILKDVGLKLRLAGIKVLAYENSFKEECVGYIYINLNTMKPIQDLYIYNIDYEFRQKVFLKQNQSLFVPATTWSTGRLGTGYIANIRESIKNRVDEFINAYLSVNLKK